MSRKSIFFEISEEPAAFSLFGHFKIIFRPSDCIAPCDTRGYFMFILFIWCSKIYMMYLFSSFQFAFHLIFSFLFKLPVTSCSSFIYLCFPPLDQTCLITRSCFVDKHLSYNFISLIQFQLCLLSRTASKRK